MPVIVALGISSIVALAAVRADALTRDGAVAAILVGTAVLYGTGWPGGGMLAAFFGFSTLVGRIALARGKAADPVTERRNARQVLANGSAAALGALMELRVTGLGLWIVCGALSAAAADTWATSIGGFSRTDPRHLLSGRRVIRGTSGAVSFLGTLGALAGASTVALAGGLAGGGTSLVIAGVSIGFGGMLLDSLLGASLQGRFECPRCAATGERRIHTCGTPADRVGGLTWLDNDGVNALSTGLAALAAAGAWWTWAR